MELFSFSFDMPEVADGDGSSGFAFVLPVEVGWEGTLSVIMLSGPGGSFALDAESDLSMAVLRDPRTGQIRGIPAGPARHGGHPGGRCRRVVAGAGS